MEALLTYWLKANVVLALFAAAYYLLLRQLTFFRLNRAYLLFAVIFAAVYPLLPMPALLPAPAAALPQAAQAVPAGSAAPAGAAAGSSWWLLAGVAYLVGAAGLLLRLAVQLLSLALLRRRSRPALVQGQAVRVVPGAGGPFSFGATIYLTASTLSDTDTLPTALRHEQAHVSQGHTFDVLLLQAATALAWPNPAAWLLRRLALDNLEYLADQAALRQSALPRQAYQRLLLRQQVGGVPTPALAFHFSALTLKNRILMLNQPLSAARQQGRYLLAGALVSGLALGYTGARAQPNPSAPQGGSRTRNAQVPTTIAAGHIAYFIDGEPGAEDALQRIAASDIASLDVVKDRGLVRRYNTDPTTTSIVFVTTKANEHAPAVRALADKANLGSAYTQEPAEVNAVVPQALAYITSHYPDARLSGAVTKLTQKSTGAVKYRVQLAQGKRPFNVYFSPQGDFLGE